MGFRRKPYINNWMLGKEMYNNNQPGRLMAVNNSVSIGVSSYTDFPLSEIFIYFIIKINFFFHGNF